MIFSISNDITSAKVDLSRLQDEIEASSIAPTLNLIRVDGDSLTITFSSTLSSEETTTLTALVLAHSGDPYPEITAPSEVKIVEEVSPQPFASKILSDGRKLFKRVHGVFETVAAGETKSISLVVPYTQAKINALEIIGAQLGDTADFNVYDNAVGTISSTLAATGYTAIPNLKLNQFGFGVCLAPNYHEEKSQYDADVIQGMKLELLYTNNQSTSVLVGANFVLHELTI